MKKLINKQLGELLIESKLITREQLTKALDTQKEKGGLIGELLIYLGYTSEEAITRALTVQYGFPYMKLSDYNIDPAVAKLVSEELSRKHSLVAVDCVGSVLTIAMSNPLNDYGVKDVEAATKLKAQIFLATATEIKQTLNKLFKA